MSKDNTPLENCPDVVDRVCELLGRRYKKGQIKEELRKILPDLSHQACEKVITAARKQIRENYKIDAQEYKGYLIEELERLLRNDKTPTKYRLKVIHELSLLLSLDQIANTEAPADYAKRLCEAMKAMDESVCGVLPGQEDNTNEIDKQNIPKAETSTQQQKTE
ncbi:MAG: hypothetical protein FVQ85_02980 [Planctomycetes bacterium]|nr:hypothetical protein [Planctomycetota bacterium]